MAKKLIDQGAIGEVRQLVHYRTYSRATSYVDHQDVEQEVACHTSSRPALTFISRFSHCCPSALPLAVSPACRPCLPALLCALLLLLSSLCPALFPPALLPLPPLRRFHKSGSTRPRGFLPRKNLPGLTARSKFPDCHLSRSRTPRMLADDKRESVTRHK